MPTTPFPIERFSGLNLVADPEEVGAGGSVDHLNVDFDRIGRVRTRDGYTLVSSVAATTSLAAMAYYKTSAAVEFIVAVSNTGGAGTVTPYNLSTGAAGTTFAEAPLSNNGFARFGSTIATNLYMGSSSGIQRYNGATWATAVGTSATVANLAFTPNSNRLVQSLGDTVAFSGAGTPETFAVNDFVSLHPGDGETIKALVTWRDYVFAFKQSKFFVFTNESVDADGQPIFPYRAVTTGHGCANYGAAVAGDEGVYFADSTGIYVTSGDAPRYISRAIEPWLRGISFSALPAFSLGNTDALGKPGLVLVYNEGRLYVTDATNETTLVYDPKLDTWMVWDLNATGMCAVPTNGAFTTGIHFGESSTKKLAAFGTATTDNSSAITWSYTSGAYDVSGENRVAVTLESALWGTGSATLKVANDHGSVDTGSALTLGTSPAVAQTWQQIDREGVWWQHQLSGSGPAIVNRLVHFVSFVKPSGVG